MHATQVLAEYVASVRFADISSGARLAAIRCVLDLMAAAVAGYHVSGAAGTRSAALKLFGEGACPVWFAGVSTTAVGAAFCNSAAASALDLDDGHRLARGHAGASVIPVVFAAAHDAKTTAEILFTAIMVGYEISIRVAAARSVNARSGVWCGYGAAAAAGWLRGTSPQKIAHALAIAGMTSPHLLSASGGPRYAVPSGNDIKEGMPWATVTGMSAIELAECGMRGPQEILDHAPHYDSGRLLDGLGRDEPMICQTYFKLHACCRHVHAPVDALSILLREHGIRAEMIEHIDVYTYQGALQISNRRRPQNLVDVQFSIPYCLGLTAYLGASCLLPMEGDVLQRSDVVAEANRISDRVDLHLDAALNARFPAETLCRVVVTAGGVRHESAVTAPRGEAADPLSWEELQKKFLTATRHVMPLPMQEAMLDAIDRLACDDHVPLLQLLTMPLPLNEPCTRQ